MYYRALGKKKVLNNTLHKEAIAPLLVVGLVVAALTGLWLQQHADDPNRGLKENIANALKQLDDLKTNSWYESDVDDAIQNEVDALETHINKFSSIANEFLALIDRVYKPKSLDDKNELDKVGDSVGSDVKSVVEAFRKGVEELAPLIISAITKFSDREYQLAHTKPSWIGDVSGWVGEALHGRWGLLANDFISAVNALNPLKESLQSYYQKALHFDEMKKMLQEKVEKALGEGMSDKGAPKEENNEGFWGMIEKFLGRRPSGKEMEFFKSLD